MKKSALIAMAILAGTALMAQKPTEGNPSSLEVQLNLTGNVNTIVAPMLKYRYFLNPNMAVRFGFGLNTSKQENKFAENPDGTGGTGTQVVKSTEWLLMPGFEYHFEGTDRLSPYLGLSIGLGGGKDSEEWTNYDGNGYNNGVSATVESPYSSFGIGILAGTDYYFAQDFFVGAEFGYMISSLTLKESTTTVSSGGTTNTIKTPEAKASSMGFNETAAIRLGWRF
ncbi:MAG: outer membrane beta-barrel protein [Fimbriimonadaceae bacterium]